MAYLIKLKMGAGLKRLPREIWLTILEIKTREAIMKRLKFLICGMVRYDCWFASYENPLGYYCVFGDDRYYLDKRRQKICWY